MNPAVRARGLARERAAGERANNDNCDICGESENTHVCGDDEILDWVQCVKCCRWFVCRCLRFNSAQTAEAKEQHLCRKNCGRSVTVI